MTVQRGKLYAGTSWGCLIVADALTMRPVSVFRPYSEEIQVGRIDGMFYRLVFQLPSFSFRRLSFLCPQYPEPGSKPSRQPGSTPTRTRMPRQTRSSCWSPSARDTGVLSGDSSGLPPAAALPAGRGRGGGRPWSPVVLGTATTARGTRRRTGSTTRRGR